MLEPLVSTLIVPCAQAQAFDVFVTDMGSWWPLHKRSVSIRAGHPPKGLRTDPRPGGQIVELGHDGKEHLWGTYTVVEPHVRVCLDFHIGMPAQTASHVEVRFTPLADDSTRVVLTQSNWEAFGSMAEMMRGGYGSSWTLIFEQHYLAACGG